MVGANAYRFVTVMLLRMAVLISWRMARIHAVLSVSRLMLRADRERLAGVLSWRVKVLSRLVRGYHTESPCFVWCVARPGILHLPA